MNGSTLLHELCAAQKTMLSGSMGDLRARIVADIGKPAWIKCGGLGIAYAMFGKHGTFEFTEPDPFSVPVYVMGVWADTFESPYRRAGADALCLHDDEAFPVLYDLAAWPIRSAGAETRVGDPEKFATRLGSIWLGDLAWWPFPDLGACDWESVRLCASPRAWLKNGCAGSVLLNRCGTSWREIFEGGPDVVCDDDAHADFLKTKLKTQPTARALPKIGSAQFMATGLPAGSREKKRNMAARAAAGFYDEASA